MAKKTGGGLPRHIKSGQSKGGNALVSDHKISKSGVGVKGTTTARHYSVKPSASSGTIGKGQPVASNSGYKDGRMTTLGRTSINTKPKK